MGAVVSSASVVLPERSADVSARTYGRRRPRATLALDLEDGSRREVKVPVRLARSLSSDPLRVPADLESVASEVSRREASCALSMLVEMLSRRDHSVSEVRSKLMAAGFSRQGADAAVSRALDLRFLDDTRFARYFVDERLRRGWGRRRIEAELKRRGVAPESVPGYPGDFFSEDDELERARSAISRKRVPDARPFEKLVRFLMGRGFSYQVSAAAVRERIDSLRD